MTEFRYDDPELDEYHNSKTEEPLSRRLSLAIRVLLRADAATRLEINKLHDKIDYLEKREKKLTEYNSTLFKKLKELEDKI